MEKKTKLTISGGAKKSIRNIEIAKTQGTNSRVIEKKTNKFSSKGTFQKQSSFKQKGCLLYTSPSPRDRSISRMPSSA